MPATQTPLAAPPAAARAPVADNPRLATLLAAGTARRDANDWAGALPFYAEAAEHAPGDPAIRHHLALGHHALGRHRSALEHVRIACAAAPDLWQARALAARIHVALGDPVAADGALAAVMARDPGNATARLDRAGLMLNAFADPAAAVALVAPLVRDPVHARDAELTTLMAALYDRGDLDAGALNDRLVAFSRTHLRLPVLPPPSRGRTADGRLRIGLLSPLFSASPVYYLAFSTLAELAREHALVCFDRGTRDDGATARFRAIAAEWHRVPHLDAPALARALAAAGLDAIVDLGGWSDPVGLASLSARPARRIWTWVGGQSATTGLDHLDGWLGDDAHLPPGSEALHTEPLVRLGGGYVDYTPPPSLARIAAAAEGRRRGVGLVGNPAKVGAAMLAAWPAGITRVTLIDRRYALPRVRERVEALLARAGVAVEAVIVPEGHDAYLAALARLEAIVVTRPYSAGLTAVEALALGVRLVGGAAPGEARLFAERHHLSHARTRGRNPSLPGQVRRLIETHSRPR